MKYTTCLGATFVALGTGLAFGQTTCINDHFFDHSNYLNPSEWTLVYEDEFNSVNTSDWTIWPSDPGEAYRTMNNVTASGGILNLEVKKENVYVNDHHYNWTEGHLWSKGSMGGGIQGNNNDGKFQHGYFEMKAKLPQGKGLHSTFWLFGVIGTQGHEIDIVEASHFGRPSTFAEARAGYRGNERLANYGTNVHIFDDGVDHSCGHHFAQPNLDRDLNSDQFNTYAVEWTPHEVTWFFNGREIRRMFAQEICDEIDIAALHPMRIILSPGYDNLMDQDSPNSYVMEVDYVRVYQKDFYLPKPMIELTRFGQSIELGPQIEICGEGEFTFSTSTTHSIQWSTDQYGQIVGGSTGSNVTVSFVNGSRTMKLTLTITDGSGNMSTRTLVITNRRDPYFFFEDYLCNNGVLSLDVRANSTTSGSEWMIAECDVNGNVLGPYSQLGWGHTYTFTGLQPDKHYRISHGVWEDDCSTWSSGSRVFETKLIRSFNVDNLTTNSTNYSLSGTAHANDQVVNHEWRLYNSDVLGTLGTQVGGVQFGVTANFSSLQYGQYYLIKHGVYSNCNPWRESRRVIYLKNNLGTLKKKYTGDAELGDMSATKVQFNLYPNPASNKAYVDLNGLYKDIRVTVRHLSGQLIFEGQYQNQEEIPINTESWSTGVYFVTLETNDHAEVKKLVIQ